MLLIFFSGIFFAVASLIVPSDQLDTWKIVDKQCAASAEKINQCWVKYSELPECESSDPVVVCGQDASQRMRLCNKEVQLMSKNAVRNYEIIHEAVCERENMKKEFEQKIACWYTARNCALKLLNETIHAVDLDSLDCKDAVEKATNCSSFDPLCTELHENLTIAVYEKSGCVDIDPNEESNSLASKFDTSYFMMVALFLAMKEHFCI